MTELHTLDQLRERAKERRNTHIGSIHLTDLDCGNAEGDLDRALKMVEEKQKAFNLLADERLRINNAEVVQERDDAHAAVLLLRDAMVAYQAWNEKDLAKLPVVHDKARVALIDTESFEQFRETI